MQDTIRTTTRHDYNVWKGFTEGPMAYPLSIHAYALSSHFVYGVTAEVVRRAVRGAL
jgi:hypothetical protein